jgi:serine/threonine-protein kinase
MGEVWAGEHEELKLPVALKVLKKEALRNDEIVKRFAREAFLLGHIHSDHVARVVDFLSSAKHGPVLVMELVEGPSLHEVLRSRCLSVEDAIDLGIDIASALRELHAANVVHRDVKPANILLRPLPGGGRRAVFVDLGVSRHVPADEERDEVLLTEITSMDRALGTIEYMAPEQILCSRKVLPTADVYAVGAVLYRAVTGRNVFGDLHGMDLARLKLSEEPPRLDTGRDDRVAKGLEATVARALARSPEERYESADELLADLSLLRDRAKRARSASTPPAPPIVRPPAQRQASTPPPLPRRALSVWAWRAAAALAGIAAGAILGASTSGRASNNVDLDGRIDTDRCTVVARRAEEGGRKVRFAISCEAR